MAGLTVLDASVLLALWDPDDQHHAGAVSVLESNPELAMATLTIAEVLVAAADAGDAASTLEDLSALGVAEIDLPAGAGPELTWLRAKTGLRMPDCCVLHSGLRTYATAIATFDRRLAREAQELGFVIESGSSGRAARVRRGPRSASH